MPRYYVPMLLLVDAEDAEDARGEARALAKAFSRGDQTWALLSDSTRPVEPDPEEV